MRLFTIFRGIDPNIDITFSDLRATLNGKDIPEDVKARLLKLHEDNVVLKEQLSTTKSKLAKAKTVRPTYMHPTRSKACALLVQQAARFFIQG